MTVQERLRRLLESLQARATAVQGQIDTSQDVNEIRALGATLTQIRDEISEAEDAIAELDAQDERSSDDDSEGDEDENPDARGINPLAAYSGINVHTGVSERTLELPGDAFIRAAGPAIQARSRGVRYSFTAPEYTFTQRAADDANLTGGPTGPLAELLINVRPDIIHTFERPTISNVFSWEPTDSSAFEYFVEQGMEGDFEAVAEGAAKPMVHFEDPKKVIDTLKMIAAITKVSEQMLNDLPRLAARINNRMLYRLALKEEYQLLYGDGTGENVLGLMNRSGLQVYETEEGQTDFDAILWARTLVSTATGFTPNALVINDLDYFKLRTAKNANGDYYGGGPFAPVGEPEPWGMPTIITPAIKEGIALIGSFNQGATAYRNGGISVALVNTNEDDFNHNLWSLRVEERVGLGVEIPESFCKLTLSKEDE